MKHGSHLVLHFRLRPSQPLPHTCPFLSPPRGAPSRPSSSPSPPSWVPQPSSTGPACPSPCKPVSKRPVGASWVRPSAAPCRASRQTFREVDPPCPASPSSPLGSFSVRVTPSPFPSHCPSPPRPRPTPSKSVITSFPQHRQKPARSRSALRARHTSHTPSPHHPPNTRSVRYNLSPRPINELHLARPATPLTAQSPAVGLVHNLLAPSIQSSATVMFYFVCPVPDFTDRLKFTGVVIGWQSIYGTLDEFMYKSKVPVTLLFS